MAGHGVGVAFGVPCGLDLKSQSLVIESFSLFIDAQFARTRILQLNLSVIPLSDTHGTVPFCKVHNFSKGKRTFKLIDR